MTSARENSHGNGAGLPRVPSIPLSDDSSAAADQSIGTLVKDATTHLSTLVRGELEMARAELGREVKKGLTGSVSLIVALIVVLLALPFLFVFLALGLNDWVEWENHPQWGFLVVFGFFVIVAAFLFMRGVRKIRRLKAPQRTIDTAKETVAALRKRADGEHPARLEPGQP